MNYLRAAILKYLLSAIAFFSMVNLSFGQDLEIELSENIDISFTPLSLYSQGTSSLSYTFPYTGGLFSFAITTNPYAGGTSDPATDLINNLNANLRSHGWDSLMTIVSANSSSSQFWWDITGKMSTNNSSIPRQITLIFSNSFSTEANTITISINKAPPLVTTYSPPLDTTHRSIIYLYNPAAPQEHPLSNNWIKQILYTDGYASVGTDSIINITYYDDIGQPSQNIAIGAGVNSGKNIVTPFSYDPLGRVSRKYLPYISNLNTIDPDNNSFDRQNNYYQGLYGEEEQAPFTSYQYIPGVDSPSKTYKIGNIYLEREKPYYSVSLVSRTADSIPKLFFDDHLYEEIGGIQNEGFYKTNALKKIVTINEDGRIVAEFIDGQGRTILYREYIYDLSLYRELELTELTAEQKRTAVPVDRLNALMDAPTTIRSDVIIVRDIYFRERIIITPMGEAHRNRSLQRISINSEWAKQWCYFYKYSGNKITTRRLPAKGEEMMIYDKGDRLVAYQDGNMRQRGEWKLIQYGIGNLVVAEYLTTSYTKEQLQNIFSQQISYTEFDIEPYNHHANLMLMQRLYYNVGKKASKVLDSLHTLLPFVKMNQGYQLGDTSNIYCMMPLYEKHLIMNNVEKWRELNNNNELIPNIFRQNNNFKHTTYYYNSQNLLKTVADLYPDGELLKTDYFYDYCENLTKKNTTLSIPHLNGIDTLNFQLPQWDNYSSDDIMVTFTLEEEMQIDKRGRIRKKGVELKKSILFLNDSLPTYEIELPKEDKTISYLYDDLGNLSSYTIEAPQITTNSVQTSYSYNIQGWMNSSSSEYKITDGDNQLIMPIYSQQLYYYSPTKIATTPLYGGGISEWQKTNGESSSLLSYTYDSRGFLIDSERYLINETTPLTIGKYTEKKITYNLNGDPLSLHRYEQASTPAHNLIYQYYGNQLTAIDGTFSAQFTYDENGNMIEDGLKDIQIEYDFNNLPIRIKKLTTNDTLTTFFYSSDGEKLQTVSHDYNNIDPSNRYFRGRKYFGPFTMIVADDTTLYFESALPLGEEIMIINNPEYNNTLFRDTVFSSIPQQLKPFKSLIIHRDHLGSVRAISDIDGNVLERNDYFPFGLRTDRGLNYPTLTQSLHNIQGYSQTTSPQLFAPIYQFNGKELLSTNYLDYGARQYNPIIARWLTQDPMAEKYYRYSPYIYCVNDPINFVDPNGMDWYSISYDDENGNEQKKYIYTTKYRSQEDLDNANIKGKYIGLNGFQDNSSVYLSLLGEKIVIKSSMEYLKSLMIQNIDKAIIKFYQIYAENSKKPYWNQDIAKPIVDMNLYNQDNTKINNGKGGLTFEYGGGIVTYRMAKYLENSMIHWGKASLQEYREYGYFGKKERYKAVTIDRTNNKRYEVVRWKFYSLSTYNNLRSKMSNLFNSRY